MALNRRAVERCSQIVIISAVAVSLKMLRAMRRALSVIA